MEGMLSMECMVVQAEFVHFHGLQGCVDKWAVGLTIKLLECTHWQWLYWNILVHNHKSGMARTLQKKHFLQEIEEQLKMEYALFEEDQYLMEVNIDDLGNSSGEQQEFWLLAVKAP